MFNYIEYLILDIERVKSKECGWKSVFCFPTCAWSYKVQAYRGFILPDHEVKPGKPWLTKTSSTCQSQAFTLALCTSTYHHSMMCLNLFCKSGFSEEENSYFKFFTSLNIMLSFEQIKVFIPLYVYIRNLFTDFFLYNTWLAMFQLHIFTAKVALCTSVCFLFLGRKG